MVLFHNFQPLNLTSTDFEASFVVFIIEKLHSIPSIPPFSPFSDETFTFSASLQRKQFDTQLNRWNYTHFCGGVLLQVYSGMAIVASAGHCLKNKQVQLTLNLVRTRVKLSC